MITLNPTLPPVPAIDASQTTTAGKLEWPSELPPPEPQGQCERSRLVTGSLPAWRVERLLRHWADRAQRLKEASADESSALNTTEAFRLESMQWAVEDCVRDLRADMARANKRQPEENEKAQPRPESGR